MLQSINEKVQGWFANTIMIVLAIAFSLWGIEYYIGRGGPSDEVAKVNGQAITTDQVNIAYQQLKPLLPNTDPTLIKQKALQQIVMTQVLSDAAVAAGFRIPPALLDTAIMQIPVFQENGQFSPQRFQQVLNALGYSQDYFVANMQRNLLMEQAETGIRKSAFVLPNETQQMLQLMDQQRDIEYAIIPAAKFQNQVTISPEAINTYYQQHQDDFRTPEKVSIDYLELSVDQLGKNIQLSDADLQQYYQNNLANFTKDGKTESFATVKNQITAELKQQKLQQIFSDQSQKLSDLTYTNATTLEPAAAALNLKIQSTDSFTRQGEKTGILNNPQIIAAAFNEDVLKNGNNSNVISIKDGDVVVLRAKNYQPATVLPLDEVKDKIEPILHLQAAQAAAQQSGQKIVQELQSGNLQQIAKQNNLQWQTKAAVTRQTPGIDMQILRAAFALPKPANSKQPAATGVTLSNGDYALVAVNQVIPAPASSNPQQQPIVQQDLQNMVGEMEYQQLYVNDLMHRAKIKIDTQQ